MHMKPRFLFVLLLLSCLTWISQAATHYTLRHYGAKEGLRAPAVNCLAQDMNGFIWIGSNMGLTRFDGAHFRTFTLRHGDAGAFALQPRSIAVDTLHRVWVGTKRGLFLFDIRTERFCHFDDALIHDGAFIRHVALDPSHRFIWVQEGERLLRIDLQSDLVEEHPQTEQPAWEPIINDATARDIDRYLKRKARVALVDRDGGYWASSFYDGLYYLHACRQPFRLIPQSASEQTTPIIRTLCRVTDDQLYVGTENTGLFLLNPQADSQLRPVALTWQGEPLPLNIQSLCADGGTLWVGTIDHGLYAYDLLTHRVVHHFDATNGLTQSLIVCLHLSRQGNLFAGTLNGLFRLDRSSMTFSPVAGAETGFIHALAETRDGTLWIGALDSRLRQLKGSTADTISSFTYPCVTALTTDAQDNLYIGTDNRGIWQRSSQAGAITPYPLTGEHMRSSVNQIVFDAEGRLWASSFNGLFCYDQRDSIFSHYDHTNGLPTDFFNYQSGLLLSDSLLVLGTYQGLVALNPQHFHPTDIPLRPFFTNVRIGERDTITNASLT